ncbi:transcription antitermination factor NusB [Pseudanabaena sp. FACHB-2040]|uniref:transcription antitermination factor NusB n=1 Tax=Pseudanabaena sp. FACHB-2040 TaxID=2692859 RepID=UPI0016886CEC|nr:transcription antitermination factor NusB [Pseudanabaena sp. FACHB-2040]MBD0268852.1 transcription antitermination protein NusB [Cyanobacteria bacterium Co-bin8]MBD2259118.1 transcription antitermination protein NusB [Pseudanabaena sp. FACHB-2040]
MQARRIGRELAVLGMSQFSDKPQKLEQQDLEGLISSAVRTLTVEAKDALETAADELKRGSNRIMDSETRAPDVTSARTMVEDAIALTQNAINRLGSALELPEFVQITNQQEVRAFSLEILSHTVRYLKEVDEILEEAMVAWQLKRLARIDRDILRTAVVEMQYLGTPDRVAINEAVELAKRYSGEEGYRFINGVLRRVVERSKISAKEAPPPVVSPQADSTF